MRTLSLLFIAFLLLNFISLAQEGWYEQTSGTSNHLHSVYFIDADNGWAVGGKYNQLGSSSGVLLKTTNGGIDWTDQTILTTIVLECLYAVNQDIAWTVGEAGTILKTTNGGTTWNTQISGLTSDLLSVHFTD